MRSRNECICNLIIDVMASMPWMLNAKKLEIGKCSLAFLVIVNHCFDVVMSIEKFIVASYQIYVCLLAMHSALSSFYHGFYLVDVIIIIYHGWIAAIGWLLVHASLIVSLSLCMVHQWWWPRLLAPTQSIVSTIRQILIPKNRISCPYSEPFVKHTSIGAILPYINIQTEARVIGIER